MLLQIEMIDTLLILSQSLFGGLEVEENLGVCHLVIEPGG